ncbi:MAG: MBL fold metallo-hydrolase [Ruminococcus sp.]|nr:MBL fold metallo-hydrolase [Ruminococcus sp.]
MRKKRTNDQYRFRIVLMLFFDVVAIVFFALDALELLKFRDVLIALGLEDKAVAHARTEVHFIDVGQGDATLVISDGHAMLIDSGDVDRTDKVVWYIRNQGITELDCVIATHPHSDHIGEMCDVIDSYDIDKFIMPDFPEKLTPTSYVYENMLISLDNKGLGITVAEDSEFTLGTCKVKLFTAKGTYDDLNNYSVLVKVTDGDNSFLITGDCENEEEKEMIAKGFDLSAKVLKVGHHGSSTSSSYEFLDEVLPRYSVISCGYDNSYGHPSDQTVSRLQKYSRDIYITSRDGTVVFYSDGEGLEADTEKKDKKR